MTVIVESALSPGLLATPIGKILSNTSPYPVSRRYLAVPVDRAAGPIGHIPGGAAMVDDSGPSWPEPPSSPRIFTADTKTARTMTWATWRLAHRRATTWWYYAAAVCSPALLWVTGVIGMRWAVVGGASLVSVFAFGDLPRLHRQFRQLAPAGTEFAVGFSATAMSLRTPLSVGRYNYSAFKSLDLSRDYVFLRSALGGTYFVLPRELFTDEDIACFRAGLGSGALYG